MKLKLKSCVTYHVNKQHYFLSVLAALFYSTKEYKNSCWLLILLKLSLCRRISNQWRIFQSYLNSCNIRFMQQIRTGFCTCNFEKHDFKERIPTANKLKSYQSEWPVTIYKVYVPPKHSHTKQNTNLKENILQNHYVFIKDIMNILCFYYNFQEILTNKKNPSVFIHFQNQNDMI